MPDYLHITTDGALIRDDTGKLFAGDNCCCRFFAIVIHNSNGAIDDNFKVLLNGTDIGHIDNNQNNFTGRIFTDTDHAIKLTPATIFTPQPNVFESTVTFDLGLLITGSNALRVETIVDHNNGNLGKVRVGYWKKNNFGKYDLNLPASLDTDYAFSDGVGNGEDFTFTYP